jgi:phosphomevalonate kinase
MAEASAPGKLVIAGEYAVLHGAPAIAVTVAPRARAVIARLGGGHSQIIGEEGAGQWKFTWAGGHVPVWDVVPPDGRGRILECLMAVLTERGVLPSELPAVSITLDSSGFYRGSGDSRRKLGLGSSAAVTVALAGALLQEFSPQTLHASQVVEICLEAHRRLQGGAGSGVDIAAAAAGGVISLVCEPEGATRWEQERFPSGLHWLALWTGYSASTTAMLETFQGFRETQPRLFAAHLGDLLAVSQAAHGAWDRADIANLLCALAAYDAALRRLDRDAGIGIYSPAHHRLAELARRNGAIYKTSGAGGGDFGLAFSNSAHVIGRVRETALREKIFTLEGGEGANGLDVA